MLISRESCSIEIAVSTQQCMTMSKGICKVLLFRILSVWCVCVLCVCVLCVCVLCVCVLCVCVCSGADRHQRGHQAADTAGGGLPHARRCCRGTGTIQGQEIQLCTTCELPSFSSFLDLCAFPPGFSQTSPLNQPRRLFLFLSSSV